MASGAASPFDIFAGMRSEDGDGLERARQAREQRARLVEVADELRNRRDASPASTAAAVEIHSRARQSFEHDVHYASLGWARDVAKLKRLIKLQRTVFAPAAHAEDDYDEVRAEYEELSRELGYEHPFDAQYLCDMLKIARAVDRGVEADFRQPPTNWPKQRRWLVEPEEWDPDRRLGAVVERTLKKGVVLLQAKTETRLRLAWCIDLALDSDRSVLERVLDLADENQVDVAGLMRGLTGLVFDGCSPLRAWLLWRMDRDDVNPARDCFHELSTDGAKFDPMLNDLAESSIAGDEARLDGRLLLLATELVETLPPSGTHEVRTTPVGAPSDRIDADTLKGNSLVRDGNAWRVRFEGEEKSIRHRIGMDYLATLIERSGEVVHVSELESPGTALAEARSAEVLDKEARSDMKQRLKSLSEERRDAEAEGDVATCEGIDEQTAEIAGYLQASEARGRRPRLLGDEAEKVRGRVKAAIRGALGEVKAGHPAAFEHLSGCIERPEGMEPSYSPPEGINWLVSRGPAPE